MRVGGFIPLSLLVSPRFPFSLLLRLVCSLLSMMDDVFSFFICVSDLYRLFANLCFNVNSFLQHEMSYFFSHLSLGLFHFTLISMIFQKISGEVC